MSLMHSNLYQLERPDRRQVKIGVQHRKHTFFFKLEASRYLNTTVSLRNRISMCNSWVYQVWDPLRLDNAGGYKTRD